MTQLESRRVQDARARGLAHSFGAVRRRKVELVGRTTAAVPERLTKEIIYWDHRAEKLRTEELAGKTPRSKSARARQCAGELQTRLKIRVNELEEERRHSPLPPAVLLPRLGIILGERAATSVSHTILEK